MKHVNPLRDITQKRLLSGIKGKQNIDNMISTKGFYQSSITFGNHYDSEKEICMLCYTEVFLYNRKKDGDPFLVNKNDGKLHRLLKRERWKGAGSTNGLVFCQVDKLKKPLTWIEKKKRAYRKKYKTA